MSGDSGSLVPVYTVEQAAEALGVSRATVHAMLRRGELRAVPTGAARCVVAADLEQHLGVRPVDAPADASGLPVVDLADTVDRLAALLEELGARADRIAATLHTLTEAVGTGEQ